MLLLNRLDDRPKDSSRFEGPGSQWDIVPRIIINVIIISFCLDTLNFLKIFILNSTTIHIHLVETVKNVTSF